MERLNLGCWNDYREGWTNVDMAPPADVVCDLSVVPWPFADESYDEILAADILEHLPDFTAFMNECHRVLRPGGVLEVIVPMPSDNFWLDPTHVRPYMPDTFHIFCSGNENEAYHGIEPWTKVETRVLSRPQVPAVHARLTK